MPKKIRKKKRKPPPPVIVSYRIVSYRECHLKSGVPFFSSPPPPEQQHKFTPSIAGFVAGHRQTWDATRAHMIRATAWLRQDHRPRLVAAKELGIFFGFSFSFANQVEEGGEALDDSGDTVFSLLSFSSILSRTYVVTSFSRCVYLLVPPPPPPPGPFDSYSSILPVVCILIVLFAHVERRLLYGQHSPYQL